MERLEAPFTLENESAEDLIKLIENVKDLMRSKGLYPEILEINPKWLKKLQDYLLIEVNWNRYFLDLKLYPRDDFPMSHFSMLSAELHIPFNGKLVGLDKYFIVPKTKTEPSFDLSDNFPCLRSTIKF